MTNVARSTSELLSMILVSLIPASLLAYRLIYASDPSLAVLICRPVILAICILLFFLLWYGAQVTEAEQRLIGVLVILCGVLLVSSLAATNSIRALQEWLKLVIMCAIAIMLCRPLRHGPSAKIFGASLLIVSTMLGGLIVSTYIQYMGMVLPSYAATRVFKSAAMDDAGIPLNPLGFECVFAYLCGMCLLRGTKLLWAIGLVLLVISSALTGSRAPLAVFAVSGLVLILVNALHSRRVQFRVAGVVIAAGTVIGIAIAAILASSQQLSALTEGRWNLWSVALHKFALRPIWGNGYLSAQDSIYLPGGYHNEYLTALAEQGIIGFLAVGYLFWFLLSCCWKLAFRNSLAYRNGQCILFTCLFLLFRALVELPGLFGTAQGPADFLAYIFLAIVISRIAHQELLSRFPLQHRNGPIRLARPSSAHAA
jgi:O-antigen ligase